MKHIFVNLKRFDVPVELGGVSPVSNPDEWIGQVMHRCVELNLGKLKHCKLTFLLPEGLILSAKRYLAAFDAQATAGISIGSQGVYRDNVAPGGNFGAFTTLLPAAAARNLGADWSIIGHSEERKDKLGILHAYNATISESTLELNKANQAIGTLLNASVHRGLESGLNVLFCVGETMEDKGEGTFEEQQPRIKQVLQDQLLVGLRGIEPYQERLVIAYEPIWAIGPGKTPPDSTYIGFVTEWIREVVQTHYNFKPSVVYGGGLKKENARDISSIPSLDGGLVALTNFVGQPGFSADGLHDIIKQTVWESIE